MSEKVLNGKKNGMSMLLCVIAMEALGILGIVYAAIQLDKESTPFAIMLLVVSIIITAGAPILSGGFKVLKPQEPVLIRQPRLN